MAYDKVGNLIREESFVSSASASNRPAGFWIRVAANLLDQLFFNLLIGSIGVSIVVGSALYSSNTGRNVTLEERKLHMPAVLKSYEEFETKNKHLTKAEQEEAFYDFIVNGEAGFLYMIIGIYVVLLSLYFAWPESSGLQGSLGKHVVGIKIVNLNYERISFFRAFVRTLIKFLFPFKTW
jgi:uncharacterized RDD family membrane protein YckC